MINLTKVDERKDLVMGVIENQITPNYIKYIRICRVNDDYILNGNDCATMLGYKNPKNAVGNKISKEYKVSLKPKNFGVPVLGTPKSKNNSIVSKTDTMSYKSDFDVAKADNVENK